MKRAIVLWGPSGAGKTYMRTHDEKLATLPFVDVADIYRDLPPQCDWLDAHYKLAMLVREKFRNGASTVVIEGYFLPNTPSRRMLIEEAAIAGYKLEFWQVWAPLEVCEKRLREQYERGEISWRDADTRIKILRKCWRPKSGE